MGEPTRYSRIGVVIPAHDEAAWIEACLHSVLASADTVSDRAQVHVVVVADACTDRTASVARSVLASQDGALVTCTARNVGVARAAGFVHALTVLGIDATWLATTDADCVVPVDWLDGQLALGRQGRHGVAGRVRVSDWQLRSPQVRTAFEDLQRQGGVGDGHAHVHGANLGFSARAYTLAGGTPALATAEDHALWGLLDTTGLPLVSTGGLVVETSARHSGRTPDGFSTLLDRLDTSAA